MKNFVALWASLRTWTLADWVWRLGVLVLPWQTRWFVEAPRIGERVWEQGRVSVYASMLVMVAFAGFVAWRERVWRRWSWRHLIAVVALIVCFAWPTLAWRATLQWTTQMAVLGIWSWAIVKTVDAKQFRTWFLISLIGPAIFGIAQSVAQTVPASTVLGVAAQDPLVRGVSVIQVGVERFLRAYSSFPHPNIFGGWMAIGLVMATFLTRERRWVVWLLPLFSLALYTSFSRAAWIAAGIGLAYVLASWIRMHAWRRVVFVMLSIGLTITVAIMVRPGLLFTRVFVVERLETKSLNERQAALQQSFYVARRFPFGTGVGAYRRGLEQMCAEKPCSAPYEPPHVAPMLAFIELGLVRVLLLLSLVLCLAWSFRTNVVRPSIWMIATPLTVLALFDHYLWSLWAGQGLLFVGIAWTQYRFDTSSA